MPVAAIGGAAVLGVLGLAAYACWERVSSHPMTPPRLAGNRPFLGLNLATLMIYAGVSIMFFLLPFELVDRRGLSATDAGLAFLPFTLAVGLSVPHLRCPGRCDRRADHAHRWAGCARLSPMLWMALAQDATLLFGVIGPMALLGISFAVIAAPITAAVLSSVAEADEGLASGINNAASRVAQLGGVALAAGVASFASGYRLGLVIAAAVSDCRRAVVAGTVPPAAVQAAY